MFWSRVPVVPVAPVVVTVGGAQTSAVAIDPVAVGRALDLRTKVADLFVEAVRRFLAADAEYRNAYNDAYAREGGPEHVRKVLAEQAAAELRAVRDAAEVARLAAEESRRLAELGFRAAMGGASPDGGERA